MNSDKRRFKMVAGVVASVVLPVLFLSGCSADKGAIQFSDEHMVTLGSRAEVPVSAQNPPEVQKLTSQDLFKVEVVIYSYLLQRHFWDDGEYSAVFLEGDDDVTDTLIKAFPNHIPPVKRSYNAELRPNRTPLDRQTGGPAMILSVDTLDPVDDTVQAIGKWYAGGAVSGFYSFSLRKTGGDWVVESAK